MSLIASALLCCDAPEMFCEQRKINLSFLPRGGGGGGDIIIKFSFLGELNL